MWIVFVLRELPIIRLNRYYQAWPVLAILKKYSNLEIFKQNFVSIGNIRYTTIKLQSNYYFATQKLSQDVPFDLLMYNTRIYVKCIYV